MVDIQNTHIPYKEIGIQKNCTCNVCIEFLIGHIFNVNIRIVTAVKILLKTTRSAFKLYTEIGGIFDVIIVNIHIITINGWPYRFKTLD